MPEFSLKDIKTFFGYPSLKAFSDDWKLLSEKDKSDIRAGLQNGTFNY